MQISGKCLKRPPRVSVHQLFWYILTPPSPTPLISSAMNTPENTQEDPDDLEPPYEGDIHMEYSSP